VGGGGAAALTLVNVLKQKGAFSPEGKSVREKAGHKGRTDWRILSIPLGPSVVFTKSAIAMAPMKLLIRALSP